MIIDLDKLIESYHTNKPNRKLTKVIKECLELCKEIEKGHQQISLDESRIKRRTEYKGQEVKRSIMFDLKEAYYGSLRMPNSEAFSEFQMRMSDHKDVLKVTESDYNLAKSKNMPLAFLITKIDETALKAKQDQFSANMNLQ
jgi:Zn-finger nucleic acid-binding protein